MVSIVDHGTDKYGRTLADVYEGDELVNRWLVLNGWAWHYKKYSDDEDLAKAEKVAQARHAGLWADVAPLAAR